MAFCTVEPHAVQFDGVSKTYAVYASPAKRLAELATFHRAKLHSEFHALRGVSFDIRLGETFCLIGENGSGKSTLLKILAGVLQPTSGTVRVNGRVAALLELGAGFHPEFTGRENVYLAAAIHGYSQQAIEAKFAAIEAFAEIGTFIDRPVKTYSSGMLVRLAFAVAIHVEPDILVVDEALAVGDFYFRQRCLRKVNELRARGATIVFVSHSMGDIQAIGDRVAWMDHGELRMLGKPDEVIHAYQSAMAGKDSRRAQVSANGSAMGLLNVDHRTGSGGAEILGLGVYDDAGDPLHWLNPRSRATVRIRFRAHRELSAPAVGFVMRNHLGVEFSGASTAGEAVPLGRVRAGETVTVNFALDLPALYPSHFSFSPFVRDGAERLDSVDNALALEMAPSEGTVYGYVTIPCRIEINKAVSEP